MSCGWKNTINEFKCSSTDFSGECEDEALRYFLAQNRFAEAQNRFAEKLFANSNSNKMALNN